MQKRAQAAMEFLMTYGWALLVVLIAIGALAFFGVLSPSKFLPENCVLGPGLACEDFKASSGMQTLEITVRNGMGQNMKQFQIYVDNEKGNNKCGGYFGYAAASTNLGTIYLNDGAASKLHNLLVPNIEGIACGGTNTAPSCCKFWNTANIVYQFPYDLCPNLAGCNQVGPQLKLGDRFSEDIVITYQEEGSNIVHQRVGHLSTRVE